MSHLSPEHITSITEIASEFSKENPSSNWTSVQTKTTQKRLKNNKKRPQTPSSIENTSFYETRRLKTTQTSSKTQKNAEIFSLPQQTTRDSIHTTISQKDLSNTTQSSQNGNKQNVDSQPPNLSLLCADQSHSGHSANGENPEMETSQHSTIQTQKTFLHTIWVQKTARFVIEKATYNANKDSGKIFQTLNKNAIVFDISTIPDIPSNIIIV